ncbi:hypothetical protein [Wukongibacter sp. M2B1]|uniref:hypothetical protein n=1 Tax=Wukongibacter sp. M2B1 TaxID=3088895 RepID=UPI003D78BF2E
MAENLKKNPSEIEQSCEFYMRSDIVDQSNIISQSNMALSAYSVITQSYSSVKINITGDEESEEEQGE